MYSLVEQAVRDFLVSKLPNLLSDSTCVIANMEALVETMNTNGRDVGCLLDFHAVQKDNDTPFNNSAFIFRIIGSFFLRYTGNPAEMDTLVRTVVDGLVSAFRGGARLAPAQVAFLDRIDSPQIGSINDTTYVFVPFEVRALWNGS